MVANNAGGIIVKVIGAIQHIDQLSLGYDNGE